MSLRSCCFVGTSFPDVSSSASVVLEASELELEECSRIDGIRRSQDTDTSGFAGGLVGSGKATFIAVLLSICGASLKERVDGSSILIVPQDLKSRLGWEGLLRTPSFTPKWSGVVPGEDCVESAGRKDKEEGGLIHGVPAGGLEGREGGKWAAGGGGRNSGCRTGALLLITAESCRRSGKLSWDNDFPVKPEFLP